MEPAGEASGGPEGEPDEVLSIVVVRFGGVAGISRRWRVGAASDQADHWIRLIDECPWGEDPPEPDTPRTDRFTWTITAQVPYRQLEKRLPEPALTGPWQTLVEAVRASAR